MKTLLLFHSALGGPFCGPKTDVKNDPWWDLRALGPDGLLGFTRRSRALLGALSPLLASLGPLVSPGLSWPLLASSGPKARGKARGNEGQCLPTEIGRFHRPKPGAKARGNEGQCLPQKSVGFTDKARGKSQGQRGAMFPNRNGSVSRTKARGELRG